MPIFNLGSKFPELLQTTCKNLTQRTLSHMSADFPLTASDIECATTPPDVLERLKWLQGRGVQNLPTHNRYTFVLNHQHTPGLDRSVAIEVGMRTQIFAQTESFDGYYASEKQFSRGCAPVQTFTPPPDKAELLAKWATRVLRETRRKDLADSTVCQVIGLCKTTGHVMARWPFLATLVPKDTSRGGSDWPAKFRSAPKNLKPYGWVFGLWYNGDSEIYAKRMEATEIILNKALMLGEYVYDTKVPAASLVAWERLPGDPKW
jgi:hypothetical protein